MLLGGLPLPCFFCLLRRGTSKQTEQRLPKAKQTLRTSTKQAKVAIFFQMNDTKVADSFAHGLCLETASSEFLFASAHWSGAAEKRQRDVPCIRRIPKASFCIGCLGPAIGALSHRFFFAWEAFPTKNRLQKNRVPTYSILSTGGPSCGCRPENGCCWETCYIFCLLWFSG